MALTPRKKMFGREYVIDFNGSRAARASGSTRESAAATACEYLKDPEVMEYITELCMGMHKKAALTAERLLDFYQAAITVDRTQLVDEAGHHKGLHELDAELAGIVEGYKITDKGVEVKLVSRLQAARDFGDHMGVFKKIVELRGGVAVASVAITTDDPNQAAAEYARLIKGS